MQVTETAAAGLKREYGCRPGDRSRGAGQRAPRRTQGPRAAARLPARQGAGRAPQAPLRQVRHGRGDRSRGARGQQQDRQRQRLQARHRAEGGAADGRGRGRRRHRRQVRPRLHGRDGDRAADHARRFQDHQARAADRRSDRRRDRSRRWQSIAEQNRPFVAKTEGRPKGRPRHDFVPGTIDGEPFEGGTGEDVPMVLGSAQFIPGLRGAPHRASRPAKPDLQRQVSRRLSARRRLPARTRRSPSR